MMIPRDALKWLTQIDKSVDLYTDRANELASFYGISADEALRRYRYYNVDNQGRPPPDLFRHEDHASVVRSYLDEFFLSKSITRLMLHYDRLDLAWHIAREILRLRRTVTGMRFMDYGCGASDYGLAFAAIGAKPIIADIQGEPILFAEHRYRLRSIHVEAVAVTPEAPIPPIPPCDIINAAEVLEHVVDPPALLRRFWEALPPGGIVTFSDYPRRPKRVGGGHLVVAANKRTEALAVLARLFVERWNDPEVGYIYEKV
jgi:2-polyprenyl-3-methyl-5-hydroxy-6-metoxy-1,4-benzoquinol methylase